MSSKRKPPSLAGRPAKDRKQQPFPCPNVLCKEQYATSRSLNMHLFKNQACAECVARRPNEKPAAQDSPPSSPEVPSYLSDDGEYAYSDLM